MKIERYTWDNALIEAGALGLLSAPAVNVALRLSRAINWKPSKGKSLGLRWDNATALKSVGSSKSAYYRANQELKRTGFIVVRNGNIVPSLPEDIEAMNLAYRDFVDEVAEEIRAKSEAEAERKRDSRAMKSSTDSQSETPESQSGKTDSQSETPESQSGNTESQSDYTYSEDIYSEDSYSEDSYSEDSYSESAADAPHISESPEGETSSSTVSNESGFENGSTFFRPQTGESAFGGEDGSADSQSGTPLDYLQMAEDAGFLLEFKGYRQAGWSDKRIYNYLKGRKDANLQRL